MSERTNKQKLIHQVQAYLIAVEYDADGKLIADGDWSEVSVQAMTSYQEATDGLESTGQINFATVTQMAHHKLHRPETWTTKLRQAWLILSECDVDGQLIADGEDGPVTREAFDLLLDDGGGSAVYVDEDLFRVFDFMSDE